MKKLVFIDKWEEWWDKTAKCFVKYRKWKIFIERIEYN
jgi:hypothetical protein